LFISNVLKNHLSFDLLKKLCPIMRMSKTKNAFTAKVTKKILKERKVKKYNIKALRS
jgi:hypothetical protein